MLLGSFSDARPMTSNKAVGYTSKKITNQNAGYDDFMNRADNGVVNKLVSKSETGPTYKAIFMESEISKLIEDSVNACLHKNFQLSLEKAKIAKKKERDLLKFREKNGLQESINIDLSISVNFNLAHKLEVIIWDCAYKKIK